MTDETLKKEVAELRKEVETLRKEVKELTKTMDEWEDWFTGLPGDIVTEIP